MFRKKKIIIFVVPIFKTVARWDFFCIVRLTACPNKKKIVIIFIAHIYSRQ